MSGRAYLDHAASSPLRPEVRAALAASFDLPGNPSSVHAEGRAARAAIEAARRVILDALGAAGGTLVFTSGATEANAMALVDRGRVLAAAVEHPSVLAQPRVEPMPVDAMGRLERDALAARLATGEVGTLAVMHGNNETGVLQPLAEIATLARRAGVRLHVDAVQALGTAALDLATLGADSVALSAHKIGGPKGVGALWLREEEARAWLLHGGGQEGRHRAGTENLSGILGFAAAVAALDGAEATRQAALRAALEAGIRARVPAAVVLAADAPRLPHISAVALPGIAAATQVMALDLAGVAVSAGAACSSGKVAPSHVLAAMGIAPALAASTIRVSLGWSTVAADIERFLDAWAALARRRARAAPSTRSTLPDLVPAAGPPT